MTTAAVVPPSMPPALSTEGVRYHLRETLLLLSIPEGSAESLILGDILSMVDDNGNGNIVRGRGEGGGVGGSSDSISRSLLSLLET